MSTDGIELPDEQRLVRRPRDVLMQLPPQFRWEVTRRHPYYLSFWQAARATVLEADPRVRLMKDAARILLLAIGFTSEPIDPATEAATLDEGQLLAAWRDGAVAPLSIRGFVGVLSMLPATARLAIGNFLVDSASGSETVEDRFERSRQLHELALPELDQHPDLPMISVNLRASDRTILAAVRALLRDWRRRFNVRAPRRRNDRLDDYLRAWDMREGWTGSTYDVEREMRFREIAGQMRGSIRTIANRYESAFQLIVGHPYSPELWVKLFGPLKLSRHFTTGTPRVSRRRPFRSRTPRPVPETVVQPQRYDNDATGLLEAAGMTFDDLASADLLMDVEELLKRGCTDAQIMERLDLQTDADARLITYLRERVTEARGGDAEGNE